MFEPSQWSVEDHFPVWCETADIGFAPEPHLHIELHYAHDPTGASLPLRFGDDIDGAHPGVQPFVPVAGRWYGVSEPVAAWSSGR